jgi:hypothetical protein
MTSRRKTVMATLSTVIVVVTIFLLATAGSAEESDGMSKEMTQDQKVSYTLGYVVMHRIASQGYHADVDAFTDGMRSVTGDAPPALDPQEMKTIMKRVLKAVEIRTSRMKPQVDPEQEAAMAESDKADEPRDADLKLSAAPVSSGQMSLPLNTQIPSGRIDTASEQTRINYILSENPNLDIRDIK